MPCCAVLCCAALRMGLVWLKMGGHCRGAPGCGPFPRRAQGCSWLGILAQGGRQGEKKRLCLKEATGAQGLGTQL